MVRDFSWAIFSAGAFRVVIWTVGAYVAFWRRRWAVTLGFGLAALNACVFSVSNAHGVLPGTLVDVASVVATPIAGLIVLGFVSAQPRRVPRPPRWHP